MGSSTPTEGPHHHALSRFFRIATEQPLASPEATLAEAIGKEFFPADVQVNWRTSHRHEMAEEIKGEWIVPRSGKWRSIPVLKVPTITWAEASPIGDYRLARTSTADLEGFKIIQSRDGEVSQELEITFRRVTSALPVERIADFRRNVTGSTTLFQAFKSLKAARLVLRTPAVNWNVRLRETTLDLNRFQAFSGTNHLQELLIGELLEDLLAAGREIENIVDTEGVIALAGIAHQPAASVKLSKLLQVITASMVTEETAESTAGQDTTCILDLIAAWTRLHTRARHLLRSAGRQQDQAAFEAEFLEQARTLTPELHGLLLSASWEEGVETTLTSSWLRLWFCLNLLEQTGKGNGRANEVERLSNYCDLAYVVRESLRALHGQPPPRFHLPSLSGALGALVEHHATECLKLPQELNLGGILAEIGQVGQGGGASLATGHLFHAIEMYIGGMFFLDIRLTGTEGVGRASQWEGATVCQILASAGGTVPGTHRQLELRQSCGLGALLHDLGVLLFPHWSRRAVELGGRRGGLHGRLLKVRNALTESVQGLLSTCKAELLAEGVFSDTAEPAVSEWITWCGDAGEADHSLLSAWYLLHHGKKIVSPMTLKKAARSVLFHAIPTQEIRADEDPAGALLVLCDEIFAWHQARDLPQRPVLQHEGKSAGLEPRAQDSVFHSIRFPGLRLEFAEATRLLVPTLDLSRNVAEDGSTTWPRIELELKDPESIPLRVYEYWLLVSQNLRRLQQSSSGWGPYLCIRSRAAPEQTALRIREMLARSGLKASLELRPYLRRWLELHGDPGKEDGFENIIIGSSAEDLGANGRIERYFPELENLIASVLREVGPRRRAAT